LKHVGHFAPFREADGYFRGIRPGLIEACWSTEPLRSF